MHESETHIVAPPQSEFPSLNTIAGYLRKAGCTLSYEEGQGYLMTSPAGARVAAGRSLDELAHALEACRGPRGRYRLQVKIGRRLYRSIRSVLRQGESIGQFLVGAGQQEVEERRRLDERCDFLTQEEELASARTPVAEVRHAEAA